MSNIFKRLWRATNKKRKIQGFALIIMMNLAAASEVISVGTIIPFLTAVQSGGIEETKYINLLNQTASILIPDIVQNKLYRYGIIFGVLYFVSAMVRYILSYAQIKFSFGIGVELGEKIYRNILRKEIDWYAEKNSSNIISAFTQKINNVIGNAIYPLLTGVTSLLSILGLIIFVNAIAPTEIIYALFCIASMYFIVILIVRKKLGKYGNEIREKSGEMIKLLQETIYGIKEIKLNMNYGQMEKKYSKIENKQRGALAGIQLINITPRYIFEFISVIFLLVVASRLAVTAEGRMSLLPMIGVLGLTAQRIMPLMQQLYSSYTFINSGLKNVEDALDLIEENELECDAGSDVIEMKEKIELKEVSVVYGKNKKPILNSINLEIRKGEKIGFIGESGSGKSTLINLISGLKKADSGKILIDGRILDDEDLINWRASIGHVPQNIHLKDDTIKKNIIIEDEKKDTDYKLKIAIDRAGLKERIKNMSLGLETRIGENGSLLSGGEKQRIGIARALYKNKEILILDEATSALDECTENKIINDVVKKSKEITIIIITHKKNTLSDCDRVYELKNGNLEKIK